MTRVAVRAALGTRAGTLFSSSCYLFKNEYATKDDALSKCTSNGGNLVSILDVNEQTFIQSNFLSKP